MVPRPSKRVSAKEKANLGKGGKKPGAGRPKKNPAAREVVRKMLTDAHYRRSLYNRLRSGTIQPGMEALLWHYLYGKPHETIETKGAPTSVTIIHKLRGAKDDESE